MISYIELLKTTPNLEVCTPVGSWKFAIRSRTESAIYVEQLKRIYGKPPEGVCFVRKKNRKDTDTFLTIRLYYNNEDQHHVKYIDEINKGCDKWDEISKGRLLECNYNYYPTESGIEEDAREIYIRLWSDYVNEINVIRWNFSEDEEGGNSSKRVKELIEELKKLIVKASENVKTIRQLR